MQIARIAQTKQLIADRTDLDSGKLMYNVGWSKV